MKVKEPLNQFNENNTVISRNECSKQLTKAGKTSQITSIIYHKKQKEDLSNQVLKFTTD